MSEIIDRKDNTQEEKPQDESDEEDTLYQFFVSEDYIEKKWYFRNVKEQPLLCSPMSSTDYDLTGQIVWPASVILSWFIDKNYEIFQNKKLIELGAGCGLAGILAARFASQVILTDGNDIVLSLLEKNKAHLGLANTDVVKLMWGITTEITQLKNLPLQSTGQIYPDYIIGADIILWPNQLKSLMYSIRWLLFGRFYELQREGKENEFHSKAFISYVARANNTTNLLYSLADQLGFIINSVPSNSFIPEDVTTFQNLQFHLFEITLSPESLTKGCIIEDETQLEIENQVVSAYLPC